MANVHQLDNVIGKLKLHGGLFIYVLVALEYFELSFVFVLCFLSPNLDV